MSLSNHPLSLVSASVLPREGAFSMLPVIDVLPAVFPAIWPCHHRSTMEFTILELPAILPSIVPGEHTLPMLLIVSKLTFIGTTFHAQATNAVFQAINALTFIRKLSRC